MVLYSDGGLVHSPLYIFPTLRKEWILIISSVEVDGLSSFCTFCFNRIIFNDLLIMDRRRLEEIDFAISYA